MAQRVRFSSNSFFDAVCLDGAFTPAFVFDVAKQDWLRGSESYLRKLHAKSCPP